MIRKILYTVSCLVAVFAEAKGSRPNIVWLVSEDNSAEWLKLYSENGVAMPNVERLAKNGLVFDEAFSCAPVCSVARSTIISGCYAPRVGAQYHRRQEFVPMPEGVKMFPFYLRKAGYYTTNCSKEDYNFRKEDKAGVWDESSGKASYRKRKADQPFFHVQNFGTTHEGQLHFAKSAVGTKTQTDPASVRLYDYHPDTEIFRYTYARYHDHHRALDEGIGKFLQKLEEDGLMDDTFIFYYGDHGGVLPRGKGYAYENGLHVPMVVHVPKNWQHLAPAKPGSRIKGFVEFVDLSATVLNLAGIEVPKGIDGSPFLGKGVTLAELNKRDRNFGYADRFDEKYDLVRTIRKGRFRYMRNYQPFNFDGLQNNYRYKMAAYREWRELYQAGKLNEAQKQFFEARPVECLFDLESDPDEVKNLAGDPAHAETLAELRGLLQEQVKGMPDLSFIPEPVFLREGKSNPVAYGQKRKGEIAGLVEIADLTLQPFAKVQPEIEKALLSFNPWERYWGLIVCSTFGEKAAPFYEKAKFLAALDQEGLVRVRAAEFLGLTKQADPRPVIMDVLQKMKDPGEATLILNTVVLLNDSGLGYEFDLSKFAKASWAKGKQSQASRRMLYLKN